MVILVELIDFVRRAAFNKPYPNTVAIVSAAANLSRLMSAHDSVQQKSVSAKPPGLEATIRQDKSLSWRQKAGRGCRSPNALTKVNCKKHQSESILVGFFFGEEDSGKLQEIRMTTLIDPPVQMIESWLFVCLRVSVG